MAAVQTVVDAIEAVPEALREFYVAGDDGKFRLDGVEDTAVLKRSLENAKKERTEAKTALAKELEAAQERMKGFDPDEYAALKKERDEREIQSATKKGEFEKLKAQLLERQQTELAAKDQLNKAMRSSLESYLVDSEATRAIASAKGVPELLLPHVRAQVRVIEDGGRFAAKVVDRDGNPRIGDANGEPMTINQLVAEMRQSEIYGRAFEASGASGSGASQSRSAAGGGQKGITRSAFDALSQTAQYAHVKGGGTVTD